MNDIKIIKEDILDKNLESYTYFLEHNFDFKQIKKLEEINHKIESIIKFRGFSGKENSSIILNSIIESKSNEKKENPAYIILIGIGDIKNNNKARKIEIIRRAIGKLIRIMENNNIISTGFEIPDILKTELSYRKMAQEIATIIEKATYHFDDFITDESRKLKKERIFYISTKNVEDKDNLNIEDGIKDGVIIANAINKARYWCDMPPSKFTPTIFANKAVEIAKEYNLSCRIFNQKEIIEMGMNGIAGVSKGSSQECRLAILEYKYEPEYVPTIAIVGKGITFDSGGLSLKPANAMETMKDDMAGAAVVLNTMQVIAQLKPKINVIALAPMAENMPDGNALKPGDVIKFYNGKTAEILNTDAEGRLILADALSYAVANYKLDAIIDLATLTGACAYFLGPFYAGLMSNNDQLADKIEVASQNSGDRVWKLPMDPDYNAAIISEIADISNTGNAKYKSGAITAAFFLKNFVDNVPWAHLDIAGVAFGVPDISYLRSGATGFGIRLLTELIMNWQI